MPTPAKLKDQARAAENRGQWTEAVVLYREHLEAAGADDPDLALWNRVGDLHLRLGETDRAVDAYERAVAGYTESGLFNNAIALCRKVLRLVPGRTAVYLRLGQISAGAGFLADARQNFLEYAERMRRAGNVEASFEALKEFADLSPEDVEVRRLLADQLLSHGHREESVEQLRILLGVVEQQGDGAAAERLREQILAIDPDADATPLVRTRSASHDEFSAALHDGSVHPEPPAGRDAGVQHGAAMEVEEDDGEDFGRLEGLEATSLIDDDVLPLAGLEATSLDADLSGAEFDPDDTADEDDALPLIADDDAEGVDAGDDDLPLLSFDDGEDDGGPPPDPLERRRAHVAAVPEDAAAREELVREMRARGLGHEVVDVLEASHRALAARGMYFEAVAPITALIGLRADDGILLQKRVEYAFRSGRPEVQVEAYLDLGRHLARHGREEKAAAVFKRVLELDPHNVEARAAAAQVAHAVQDAAGAPPAPALPPRSDYVDLAALVLDGAAGEGSTRFVVEEKEPSGDEDRDFAEMLAHFRQKVSENIEVEDSASHYDLGVAFMEMGLVDEAIAQFQVALRGGANPLATLELLGQCFVDKEQHAVAGRVLERALRLPGISDGDLVGVLYLLGRIDEATGEPERALEQYERVVSVDIRFRDTAARIERLRAGSGGAAL